MLYTHLAAALAGLAIGATGAWQAQSWRQGANERDRLAAEAKQLQATARQTFRIQENRDAENLRTGDLLADALLRLRQRRAVRLVETPASCDGASPAALSAEDGSVALRLAAEADRLRADHIACREWIDAVTSPTRAPTPEMVNTSTPSYTHPRSARSS